MNEIWKDINGFEGYYQVSNLGNIKSLQRKDICGRAIHEKILKQQLDKDGYPRITLRLNGKRFNSKHIHRLVAEAFIENNDSTLQVNHKDLNKLNNSIENLEWVTGKENMQHAYDNGVINITTPSKIGVMKIKKRIKCIETNTIYNSIRDAANELKLNEASISNSMNPRQRIKHVNGYHFIKEN